MRVEVKSDAVVVKEGLAKASGRPYKIREQLVWVDTGRAYPSEVRVRLADTQPAFAVGRYVIGSQCLWVDRYGSLMLDLAHMVPERVSAVPASKSA